MHSLRCGNGLPLDAAYSHELNELRDQGAKLLEIGMFAKLSSRTCQTMRELLDLMRFVPSFTVYGNVTDIIAGVHPRHAEFYCRLFGFVRFGRLTSHPTVKNKPVVLLRANVKECDRLNARGTAYWRQRPIDGGDFDARFRFDNDIRTTLLGEYFESVASSQAPQQDCALLHGRVRAAK